jgi:hypothetical protein
MQALLTMHSALSFLSAAVVLLLRAASTFLKGTTTGLLPCSWSSLRWKGLAGDRAFTDARSCTSAGWRQGQGLLCQRLAMSGCVDLLLHTAAVPLDTRGLLCWAPYAAMAQACCQHTHYLGAPASLSAIIIHPFTAATALHRTPASLISRSSHPPPKASGSRSSTSSRQLSYTCVLPGFSTTSALTGRARFCHGRGAPVAPASSAVSGSAQQQQPWLQHGYSMAADFWAEA